MKTEKTQTFLPQLTILFFICVILRVYHLGDYSLWADEMLQVTVASSAWSDFFSLIKQHSSPPLDYFLIRLSKSLLGDSDWVVRLPAFVFGIASIPLFYYLCRILTNTKTALIAVTLLVFSPMAIGFSQEARMYSLFLFLSMISYCATFFFIKKNTPISGMLWGVVNGLLILAHYFGIFVILLETFILFGMLLINTKRLQRIKGSAVGLFISFLLFVPMVPVFLAQLKNRSDLYYALKADLGFLKSIFFRYTSDTGQVDVWVFAFFILFLLSPILAWIKKDKKIFIITISILGVWALLFGIAFFKPMVTPKNTVFLLPLFYLACASVITEAVSRIKINLTAAVLVLSLLLFWPAAHYHLAPRKAERPDWKGAIRYIEEHSAGKEKILTTDFLTRGFLSYYMIPDAVYGIMKEYWIGRENNPEWRILIIDDVLTEKLIQKNFTGWVIIPPAILGVWFYPEFLNEHQALLGEPVKQFITKGAPLKLYYVKPASE